jgi:predicted kinase
VTASPRLIVFAGIPRTGKSTLADHAARWLRAPLFSKDWLEACLWRSGVTSSSNSGWAAYELLAMLADQQLALGQSAILHSVATYERIRARWRALAERAGADLRVIETICWDEALLRRRVASRRRGIPGWPELSWEEVAQARARCEPWTQERLVLGAVTPLDVNLASLWSYLERTGHEVAVSAV